MFTGIIMCVLGVYLYDFLLYFQFKLIEEKLAEQKNFTAFSRHRLLPLNHDMLS